MGDQTVDKKQYLIDIHRHISRMPPLSTTITKVMEICNHPNTSPHDLNRVISLDPVLTGKVLKLVNSIYYSPVNKVNSLTRAIIMLGLNTVVNLAASTSILEAVGTKESFLAFSMDDFWTHSIYTGVMAKSLAAKFGISPAYQEEYLVAGLLHDLGKIPMNRCFNAEYHKALKLSTNKNISLNQAEETIFGIDHCFVGELIAKNWQLGQVLHDTLCCHHNPDEAEKESRQQTVFVSLANFTANILKVGSSGNYHPDKKMASQLLKQVGFSWSDVRAIHETVSDEIEKAKVFLQISTNRSSHEN